MSRTCVGSCRFSTTNSPVREWLVGGRGSAAELSYVPFHSKLNFITREAAPDVEKDFPNVDAWYKRMLQRDTVQKKLNDRDEATKKLSFPVKQ